MKEYLIAISKDITELNKVLREDIEAGEKIGFCVYQLLVFGFNLDRMADRRHLDIADQFTKHISLLLKKN